VTLSILGYLLPLLVFGISTGLTLWARLLRWPLPEETPPPSPGQEPSSFLQRYRWEIGLAIAVLSILLFAILFAPPPLTGQIPPDPYHPGRPFFSLRWERAFLRDHREAIAGLSNALVALIALAVIAIAMRRRSRLHAEGSLLLASLSLAILAQWTLGEPEIRRVGALLYAISLFGMAYWLWTARHRLLGQLQPTLHRPPWEAPLFLLLIALTIYGRFYALGAVPYGIEGDEGKWTHEAVQLGILGKPDPSGEYHRDALPVSFYLQTPFHRLFGPSLFAARFTVALLSVLASAIFYLLLRRLGPLPLAGLATYLLAVSIFDISASRLANVESFVKLWAVLPLALVAWAIEKRLSPTPDTKRPTWQPFALAGLALALAMLTYDTLWPMVGVCLILAWIELRSLPSQEQSKALAALLTPGALVLPVLIPYFFSRLSYYALDQKGWEQNWLFTLGRNTQDILSSWFVQGWPDFLYNREGPLLNAALLPWLALGTITSLMYVRERIARWLLVWAFLVILPVPILTHSPLGRVYYPALPAIYGLSALGLFVFWQELRHITAPLLRPFLAIPGLTFLVWLGLTNFYIYFNEVADPPDRQMRREIGEIAATITDTSTLMVLAVVPGADEPLNNERQSIELFLLKHLSGDQIERAHRRLALHQVLPAIFQEWTNQERWIIVLDRETLHARSERQALRQGLQRCFPAGILIEGRFFDRFLLDDQARNLAACQVTALHLTVQSSPRLRWELSAGRADALTLLCDRQTTNFLYRQAEEMTGSVGWHMEINFAPDWTGQGFMMDSYGSHFLSDEFPSPFQGPTLYVWARTFKRVADHSPPYLTVNGVTAPFATPQADLLNQWTWERLGPFPNGEIIRATIARPYNEPLNRFTSIFFDAFLFTDDPTLSPNDALYQPLAPRSLSIVPPATSGAIHLDLPAGRYRCHAQLHAQANLVDALGRTTITSNEVTLILP